MFDNISNVSFIYSKLQTPATTTNQRSTSNKMGQPTQINQMQTTNCVRVHKKEEEVNEKELRIQSWIEKIRANYSKVQMNDS